MRDGTEFDIAAGDVASVPPGHDAWVVGDEPVTGIEFVGGRIATEGLGAHGPGPATKRTVTSTTTVSAVVHPP
jgi:hypothetical protein